MSEKFSELAEKMIETCDHAYRDARDGRNAWDFQEYRQHLLEILSDNDLDQGGRVHNWRNHINSGLESMWPQFPLDIRVALWISAEQSASNEHWD